jgi:predicted nuclease of predicted toxin-antitoxin system
MPAFFRGEGFETTTILELFGRTDVPDVEWIRKAGELGMVVAHKDARIRYRPVERQAVVDARLRMLCLTSGNLTASEQVDCFRINLKRIEKWWDKPGPWILAIRKSGVEQLDLSDKMPDLEERAARRAERAPPRLLDHPAW